MKDITEECEIKIEKGDDGFFCAHIYHKDRLVVYIFSPKLECPYDVKDIIIEEDEGYGFRILDNSKPEVIKQIKDLMDKNNIKKEELEETK